MYMYVASPPSWALIFSANTLPITIIIILSSGSGGGVRMLTYIIPISNQSQGPSSQAGDEATCTCTCTWLYVCLSVVACTMNCGSDQRRSHMIPSSGGCLFRSTLRISSNRTLSSLKRPPWVTYSYKWSEIWLVSWKFTILLHFAWDATASDLWVTNRITVFVITIW